MPTATFFAGLCKIPPLFVPTFLPVLSAASTLFLTFKKLSRICASSALSWSGDWAIVRSISLRGNLSGVIFGGVEGEGLIAVDAAPFVDKGGTVLFGGLFVLAAAITVDCGGGAWMAGSGIKSGTSFRPLIMAILLFIGWLW